MRRTPNDQHRNDPIVAVERASQPGRAVPRRGRNRSGASRDRDCRRRRRPLAQLGLARCRRCRAPDLGLFALRRHVRARALHDANGSKRRGAGANQRFGAGNGFHRTAAPGYWRIVEGLGLRRRAAYSGVTGLLRRTILAFLLIAVLALPAHAHSLKELDDQLISKEKYFQPVDIAAPEFTLRGADGGAVSLTDYRGKVVVLNFVYTNCPDECPLQPEKIARIQTLITHTPMRDLVAFVTITTDPQRDRGQVLSDYGKAR